MVGPPTSHNRLQTVEDTGQVSPPYIAPIDHTQRQDEASRGAGEQLQIVERTTPERNCLLVPHASLFEERAEIAVAIGEPQQFSPWLAVGESGPVVRTAQTRIRLTATVGVPNPSLGGGVKLLSVTLPLHVEVA